MKSYELFLFDLDDTLLDFRASEKLSFHRTMQELGLEGQSASLFAKYQVVNPFLWKLFEEGKISKDHLKVERFRRILESHRIDLDPESVSHQYLETLPETVVLHDQAAEVCEEITRWGEIGIITNGIHSVQSRRIQNSSIAPYISFVCVSDDCGFAKPDVRFFEHSVKMAKRFSKDKSLVIGDRIDIDVQGAKNFGVDSCWFNPKKATHDTGLVPSYEIHHLSQLLDIKRKQDF